MKILIGSLILIVMGIAAHAAGPMTGRMAKFNIAGRIVNNHACNLDAFDRDEAFRLQELAKQDGADRLDAFKLGQGDAANVGDDDPEFCKQLRIDAGNWSMLLPVSSVPDEVLTEIKMFGALEQNNCNWDDAKQADFDPAPYPTIAKYGAADDEVKRAIYETHSVEPMAMYSYDEIVTQAQTDGQDYGLGEDLGKICPIIERYAMSLPELQ
jgi:hypothetical protein